MITVGPDGGKIVTCLRIRPAGTLGTKPNYGLCWEIDQHIIWENSRGQTQLPLCPDRYLLPIRDPGDDAVDEMVLRAGKPEGVMA